MMKEDKAIDKYCAFKDTRCRGSDCMFWYSEPNSSNNGASLIGDCIIRKAYANKIPAQELFHGGYRG